MTGKYFVFFILAGFLFISGCSRIHIHFNSYQSRTRAFPTASSENTIAIAIGSGLDEPLLDEEVTAKIVYMLHTRGYQVVPQEEARYIMSCWYAIDSGKTYTGIMPIYEPGEVVTRHVQNSRGRWKTVTTHLPGYTQYIPYSYTVFAKQLGLTLQKNQLPNEKQETVSAESIIWRCTNINADESPDLRGRISPMLVMAFDYLGKNTGRQMEESISVKDKRIRALDEGVNLPTQKSSAVRVWSP